jgi:valyl-tRNA synthetase
MKREIEKIYSPSGAESKWYSYWMKQGYFNSKPDKREPYCIVIPPPNVTGVLHMGHMLNNTIQDVLVRRARMLGKNACWVPGTDHASIATEARVVAMLREKGIKKSDLSREEFLKHAWEWKEKYGGIILDQLKKLGASCDWNRTRFTMDKQYYDDVISVFIDLYKKGYIYRGLRMVNWDPVAKTAVSDEEVVFKEVNSKLVYVKYRYEEGEGYLTVATVRPETIMGDVAVAVHPDDERYKHLHGKKVIVPLVNRAVPVITDEAIDKEFGTGCLKVTPAHDTVDYEIGLRHNLPVIDTLNEDGTISEAGQVFIGMDRFAARKAALKKLEEDGLIEKMEEYRHQVGHSERTHAVIEPRLSLQWFLRMKEISKPALEAVLNGEVNLIPGKFVNTYRHWMENVKDWCLSRQLWWGHRIPAWYDSRGNIAVCKTKEEAFAILKKENKEVTIDEINQDEDVLDTWASSWLWPISVFNGYSEPDNEDIRYYYPTNDLVTAPEILFFWVARMIIAGYEFRQEKPFTNVYLTGIVRDKQGRKMSKSLGNSPEPLELIEKYGADGVRVGMLLCSPAGNDLLFDESYCEQGRNFANKIWNAFRLIYGWKVEEKETPERNVTAANWFHARFQRELSAINEQFSKYRISEALMSVYKLIWDDFCSWYLEMVKPDFENGTASSIDRKTYDATVDFFNRLLKVLHPFMPFITEEIWQELNTPVTNDSIMIQPWPSSLESDSSFLSGFELASDIIIQVRNIRKQKNIPFKQKLPLILLGARKQADTRFNEIIRRLGNLSAIGFSDTKPENAVGFISGGIQFFLIVDQAIDSEEERQRLLTELDYQKGFLQSVMKKLNNPSFISKARPEVIASEEKKKADAENKILTLQEQLSSLKG